MIGWSSKLFSLSKHRYQRKMRILLQDHRIRDILPDANKSLRREHYCKIAIYRNEEFGLQVEAFQKIDPEANKQYAEDSSL